MLAVSWLVSDLAMPMLIGVVMSITLRLDVLNDRTTQPNPGGGHQMVVKVPYRNGFIVLYPQAHLACK